MWRWGYFTKGKIQETVRRDSQDLYCVNSLFIKGKDKKEKSNISFIVVFYSFIHIEIVRMCHESFYAGEKKLMHCVESKATKMDAHWTYELFLNKS